MGFQVRKCELFINEVSDSSLAKGSLAHLNGKRPVWVQLQARGWGWYKGHVADEEARVCQAG